MCDHEYTSLQWFLGCKPAPRQVALVVAKCKANALELRNGDTKTLESSGFARTPPELKELLVGRHYLPSAWCDTGCKAVKDGSAVQLRRPGDVSQSRGVLWRVSDLQQAL